MPTCLRQGRAPRGALPAGEYLAVTQHHELPPESHEEDCIVRHGYAAEAAGAWYFFGDLEPAIVFGRAARMSLDCRSYNVFQAAHETRHCVQHGDERVLVFIGYQLDRGADEADVIARFAAGIAEHPRSSYWHPPTG